MRPPPYPLPKPGESILYDFRPEPEQGPSYPPDRPVKLVQWNIERGYKLDAVIEELRRLDADVLALQEIDIHCERSNWADTGRAIAEALNLSYAFVCEFEELHSPLRSPDTQGGGVHGNAILSKFKITDVRAVEHTTHPVDWELPPDRQPHPLAAKEPRHGRRLTAAATVHTHQGPLLVYSAHLECFCGALARMAQVSDIFRDTRQQDLQAGKAAQQQQQQQQHELTRNPDQDCPPQPPVQDPQPSPAATSTSAPDPPTPPQLQPDPPPPSSSTCPSPPPAAPPPRPRPTPTPVPAALLGDLNTLANGVARLSPHYCTDHLRWGSLGRFEAELWDRRVLSVRDPAPLNEWARRQGLSEAVCRDLVNPGYADPFNVRTDITFDHDKYRWLGHSFMTGKLDWVLLRRCRVVSRRMGNQDYSASDHKWLQVEVHVGGGTERGQQQQPHAAAAGGGGDVGTS